MSVPAAPPPEPTPTWVKVAGIVFLVGVVVFGVVHLVFRGGLGGHLHGAPAPTSR